MAGLTKKGQKRTKDQPESTKQGGESFPLGQSRTKGRKKDKRST
jgi:hypothetical protein